MKIPPGLKSTLRENLHNFFKAISHLFTNSPKRTIVCIRDECSEFLTQLEGKIDNGDNFARLKIIKAAAQILTQDIKAQFYTYPILE